jgi:hypothetical protein
MAGLYCICDLKREFSKAGLKNHQNSCDIYKKYRLNNEEKKVEEIEESNDEVNCLRVKMQKQNEYLDEIIAENLNLKRRLQSLKRKKECQRYEKGPVFYVESTETRPGELRPGFTTNMTKRHREHHSNLKDGQGKLLYFIYSAAAKTIESIVLLKFDSRKVEKNKDWMNNVTLNEIQTVARSVMSILSETEYREVYPSAEGDQKTEHKSENKDSDEKSTLDKKNKAVSKVYVLRCDPVKFEDEDEKYMQLKRYERVPENMEDSHKKCSKCLFLKPKEKFDKNTKRKDGISTYCKRCLRVKRIQHKAKLPKLDREAERTCQECNKVKQVKDFNHNSAYLDGYSGSCKQCTVERAYDEGRIGQHQEPKSEKTCTHCKELKAITEFSVNRSCIDGMAKLCKICLSERRAEYRERKAAEKLAEAAEKE